MATSIHHPTKGREGACGGGEKLFISFPMNRCTSIHHHHHHHHQVLSKSSKIIPVMVVGVMVHHKSYPWRDYVEATLITLGVFLFLMNDSKPNHGEDGYEGGGRISQMLSV